MKHCLCSSVIISYIFLYGFHLCQIEEVAKSSSCFGAVDTTTSYGYEFYAPYDGVIEGIKLEHNSGEINCNVNSYDYYYWGCRSTRIMVTLMSVTDTTNMVGTVLYPTTDMDDLSTYSTLCNDCNFNSYVMNSYDCDSDPLILYSSTTTYNVYTTQLYALQICESVCDYTTYDNDGTTCAKVTFLYKSIEYPTNEPSKLPTKRPSDKPTITPTTMPSENPTIVPTIMPTIVPSNNPSHTPTIIPTGAPSSVPSIVPSDMPTYIPSEILSIIPTDKPTHTPSIEPSSKVGTTRIENSGTNASAIKITDNNNNGNNDDSNNDDLLSNVSKATLVGIIIFISICCCSSLIFAIGIIIYNHKKHTVAIHERTAKELVPTHFNNYNYPTSSNNHNNNNNNNNNNNISNSNKK